MGIDNYFRNISKRLNADSDEIRDFFKTHKPSAGSNREDQVAKLLTGNLPSKFKVSHGLVYSAEGEFSSQADVLICDHLNNAPLFGDRAEPIWLVESIYSLIEVKTSLSPSIFDDCIKKCIKFKSLKRNFSDRGFERITDSLFIIFAFEGPSPGTFRDTIVEKFQGLNVDQRPDLIIVPNKYVCISGQYQALARLGQLGSAHHQKITNTPQLEKKLIGQVFEIAVLNEHSLLASMVWLTAWLHQAGERYAPLTKYLPKILESEGGYELFT